VSVAVWSAWLDLDPAEDTDAMPLILGSSVSYRIAVGPQQGRKGFMIRTIRPSMAGTGHPGQTWQRCEAYR